MCIYIYIFIQTGIYICIYIYTYWISSWVPYSCYASKFFEKNHPSALIQRNKSSAALFGPESYGKCLGPGPQPNPKHLFLQLRIGEVFTVFKTKAFTKLAMKNGITWAQMSCMKPSFSTKWLTQIVRLDCPIQIQTLTTHGVFFGWLPKRIDVWQPPYEIAYRVVAFLWRSNLKVAERSCAPKSRRGTPTSRWLFDYTYLTTWWLNHQPIWKKSKNPSNWIISPIFSGWKRKKCWEPPPS